MADRRSLLDGHDDDGEERRRSMREDMNVFDDEFEVDDFDLVADGFRPAEGRGSAARQDHDREMPTMAAHYASNPPTPTRGMAEGALRNSTRKSWTYANVNANPFASPEDEQPEAPLRRTLSGNFTTEMAHRSVSSASSNVYASTHSPRVSAGGPSHPYGMYPQGTMARTPSAATQSTVRPQRNSSVRGGPAHPYTMYPQGVGDDLEDEHESPQNLVPVGFPGLGQSYQRRMGPEGEDQDLIGDFGHTEQLPPYTRYPEDGPEKPLLGLPDPPTALHSRAPVQGSDPGNPLMHTPLQPQSRQSMSDESTLRRQHSVASRRSTLLPLEPTSSSDTLMGNKRWNEKTWQERRRTRLCCGIPFLWVVVGLIVLLFTGALIGGVLGGYWVGRIKGTKSAEAADSTFMYDASFIATPTVVPLPTGTFALPFGPTQEPDDACLVSAAQAVSWSCEFGGGSNTMIEIALSDFNNATGAFLYPGANPTGELLYGLQVSSLGTQFTSFLLVKDKDDPKSGNAFYFQTTYDKVVVLPGDALSGDVLAGNKKRDYAGGAGEWGVTKNAAEIGDKPWFCYWNDTSVEAFVYADKPLFTSTPSSTSATPTPAPSVNYSAAAAEALNSGSGSKPGWVPPYATLPPTQTITTSFDMSTTTYTYTGEASALPSWLHENYPEYTPEPWLRYQEDQDDSDPSSDDPSDPSSPSISDAPGRHKRRGTADDVSWTSGQSVPIFPYLVKVEERRKQGAPAPYCQQYQLLNDGTWNWIPDPENDNEPITIKLEEKVPSYEAYSKGQQKRKRTADAGACHCQWIAD